MKAISRSGEVVLLALFLAAASAFAQSPSAQERPTYPQQELDSILAPVALYPDALLSQVLMAATYPLEVVQAARWSRSNPGIGGDDAVRAVDAMDWDPSVKSLVAFPQILLEMDQNLEWTQRLGDAFLSQEAQVMQTVQGLRQKAQVAGNLRSTDQIVVEQQGDDIIIEPPGPDVVYVPYYDPLVVYGPWWWGENRPVYWGPWNGYDWTPGYAGLGWGLGIAIGGGFFYGAFDWPRHSMRVRNHRPFYFHGANHRPVTQPDNMWRHDPTHRRGVPYRNPNLRQQYGGWSTAPDGRRDYRGRDRPATITTTRPEPAERPTTEGFFAPRSEARPIPATKPSAALPSPAPTYPVARPAPLPRPSAFEGVGHGQETRNSSMRGQQSLPSKPPASPAVSQPSQNAPPSPSRSSGSGSPPPAQSAQPSQR